MFRLLRHVIWSDWKEQAYRCSSPQNILVLYQQSADRTCFNSDVTCYEFLWGVPVPGFSMSLFSLLWDDNPWQSRAVHLDQHLSHGWNYSTRPLWNIGSKSTEMVWDNWNAFLSQPRCLQNYLCVFVTLYIHTQRLPRPLPPTPFAPLITPPPPLFTKFSWEFI